MPHPTRHDEPHADTLLAVDDVADYLSINYHAARKLFNVRAFPLVRIGQRLYVRHRDVVAYLDAQTIPAKR